jgi:hypothetical protein
VKRNENVFTLIFIFPNESKGGGTNSPVGEGVGGPNSEDGSQEKWFYTISFSGTCFPLSMQFFHSQKAHTELSCKRKRQKELVYARQTFWLGNLKKSTKYL